MSEFHFLRPWWLLGLALIIAWPLLRRWFEQSSGWSRVLAPHLIKPLTGEKHSQARRWPLAVCLSMWSLLCVSLAGPAWERLPMPVFEQDRGIVLVMDMSMNTRASDISPDRLSRLRFKALDLLDDVDGAQVGIIAYAGDAFSISPLTYDFSNIRTMIPALSPEIMPVAGNYPLLAMREAHRMLTDSGIRHGEIIWLSAGMTRDDYQELNTFFRGKNHQLSALIAGTDERAPIRLADGNIMRDSMGRIEMAHINPNDFERLTRAHNGIAVRLRADDEDIQQLLAHGAQHSGLSEADEHLTADEWLDRGPYLAWLLIPMVLLLTRRGVLMSICLLPFTGLLMPPTVHAASQPTNQPDATRNWQLPFQNSNQRAEQLYRQGLYEQAATLFTDPQRQGDAWYRAGEYEQALNAYQQADGNAENWFNRGNALARTGQYAAAEDAYAEALQRRPDWQEALENKALMEQLQDQEQEQQQGDSDEESDSSEQDETQDEGSDDSSESDSQDEQAHDEQGSEGDEQGSDSQDESDQQADDSSAAEEEQQEQSPEDMSQTDSADDGQSTEERIHSALMNEDLTDEEREELEQLLRRVTNDPAQLLRNRMRLEAEQRMHSQPQPPRTQSPRGAR